MRYLIVLLIFSFSIYSCNSAPKKTNSITSRIKNNTSTTEVEYIKSIKITSPQKHDTIKMNDKISLDFKIKKRFDTDSLQIYIDGVYYKTLYAAPFKDEYSFTSGKAGSRQIKTIAYHKNGKRGLASTYITLIPDKAPKRKIYRVVKTYKHDTKAYTQGLVFHNGFLYEGTGQIGESCIKKIDLNNNDIISVLNIDNSLFGEGITIYNNKIFQLTWTSFKGFIYDINSFSLESEFTYSTQGWGITTMGNELVMSDGTHKLYIIDPNSFSVKSEIEVYDNKGIVDQLNELEYINGMIYANVWMTNRIIMIDPSTGIVKEDVDLSGILSEKELKTLDDSNDVLNGIAYDNSTNKIYITGKRWPKLFHIELK